jgi:hypothetical protein
MESVSFARRFDNVTGSAIREIFKVLGRPGMISFAATRPWTPCRTSSAPSLPATRCSQTANAFCSTAPRRAIRPLWRA